MPASDVLIMLGDFNARVGVLKAGEDEWQGIIESMDWMSTMRQVTISFSFVH